MKSPDVSSTLSFKKTKKREKKTSTSRRAVVFLGMEKTGGSRFLPASVLIAPVDEVARRRRGRVKVAMWRVTGARHRSGDCRVVW